MMPRLYGSTGAATTADPAFQSEVLSNIAWPIMDALLYLKRRLHFQKDLGKKADPRRKNQSNPANQRREWEGRKAQLTIQRRVGLLSRASVLAVGPADAWLSRVGAVSGLAFKRPFVFARSPVRLFGSRASASEVLRTTRDSSHASRSSLR